MNVKFTHLGNIEILKEYKVAFFCSQKCPSHLILKSYDWAIEQRENGVCIISGFHSKIEKDILDFLLKGTQPIILVLARNMKKQFPAEQRKAIKENRLLVISPFDEKVTQNSRESCFKRNEVILEIADEIVVAFATKNGKLENLLKKDEIGKSCKVWRTEEMCLTQAPTFRLKEKQEERGVLQPLNNIPLRSMLFNGGVPLTKTRNRIES